jgi:hypothetical protein
MPITPFLRLPRRPLLVLLAAAAALLASSPLLAAEQPKSAAELPKTIVIGFDGVDARLTEQWMAEGKLPNLAKLRDEGTFSPLQPTIPSQTPVSWSTFATGLDPGRHGIIDFLKRDPENYRPRLALIDEGQKKVLLGHQNPWLFGAGRPDYSPSACRSSSPRRPSPAASS